MAIKKFILSFTERWCMEITRDGEYVIAKIKLASPEQAAEVQEELEYFQYLEIIKKMKPVSQQEVDDFANNVKRTWWENNKNRFI